MEVGQIQDTRQRAGQQDRQNLVVPLSVVSQEQDAHRPGLHHRSPLPGRTEEDYIQGIAVAPHRLGEEGPRDHAVVGGVGEVLHHARRAVLYLPFEFSGLGDLPLGVGPRRNLHHHIDETGFGDCREVGMVVSVSARCQILEGTAGDH